MAYIGRGPEYGALEKQDITGDGSTTTYALDYTVGSDSSILVSVAGVVQQPGTAYNLSGGGTSLVFSAAPANGAVCFVIFFGMAYDAGALLDTGTITGKTLLNTSPASDDMFLVYDDDASALKKVAYSDVHTGVANMAANTVKVRDANSTGAPSDKAVGDTQLLIGDGTGFTAASLSGDVTMANTGAVTIANTAVENAMVATGIDAAKLADGTVSNAEFQYINSLSSNAQTQLDAKVAKTGATGSGILPVGTTAQRDGSPSAGYLRFNSDETSFEGWNGAEWGSIGGGIKWSAQSTNFNAAKGNGYLVVTSSAVTATLPAAPALGDEVRLIDATGQAATNNITVNRNGKPIQGSAANLTIATNRAAIGLVFYDNTQGWLLIEN
jgi:hypothetical protein